jgi:O-antigen ligase
MEKSMLNENQLENVGAIGWKDPFRERLNSVAIAKITNHPIWGEGWSFSFEDIVDAVTLDVQQGGLAYSGGFHNLLLTYATKLGIPLAAFVLVLFLTVMIRFFLDQRRRRGNPDLNMFKSSLFFFALIYIGFSLTNGAGQEVVGMFTIIGAMLGIMARESESLSRESRALAPAQTRASVH